MLAHIVPKMWVIDTASLPMAIMQTIVMTCKLLISDLRNSGRY